VDIVWLFCLIGKIVRLILTVR